MRDKILLTYVLMDVLFLASGALLIVFALKTEAEVAKAPTIEHVARDLLLMECPLNGQYFLSLHDPASILMRWIAAVGNAVMIFVTFLISVPAIIMPMTRGWLKLHGYMVVVCALFTLVLGLDIWFDTLKTRSNLNVIWNKQPNSTQSLLQQEVRTSVFDLQGPG